MLGRVFDVARSIASIEGSENNRGASFPSRAGKTGEMNENPSTPKRIRQGMDYGETEEVLETHAAIQREKREPRAGLEPLSLWLIALYGLAVFFAGAYLGRYSGNFSGDGLDPLGGAEPVKKHGAAGGGATQAA